MSVSTRFGLYRGEWLAAQCNVEPTNHTRQFGEEASVWVPNHLAVAAPDLLAALDGLLAIPFIRESMRLGAPVGEATAIDAAVRAIAKARNEGIAHHSRNDLPHTDEV